MSSPAPYPPDPEFPVVRLGGLPIAVIDRKTSAQAMISIAVARRGSGRAPFYSTSANGEVLSLCARRPEIRKLFSLAGLVHADGMPMVLASRFVCREPLPERVATTDLFHDVAIRAVERDASFFMLGATEEALARADRKVRQLYPALRLLGTRHGYVRPEEEDAVIQEINALRPDILWVSMGAPREQDFVVRNLHRLTGVGLVKTSGGLFDFLSGNRSRAPRWMQDSGLEWLYRLHLEPRRLFRRYALTNPHALFLLMTRSA